MNIELSDFGKMIEAFAVGGLVDGIIPEVVIFRGCKLNISDSVNPPGWAALTFTIIDREDAGEIVKLITRKFERLNIPASPLNDKRITGIDNVKRIFLSTHIDRNYKTVFLNHCEKLRSTQLAAKVRLPQQPLQMQMVQT